jgi:hypothetical protein
MKLKLLKEVYKPKESEIRQSIQRYLDLKGIFNWRQWQGQFSVKGVPDIIAILPGGRALGIEVKVPGWKFKENSKHECEQLEFLSHIGLSGGVGFFATSIEEVERQLEIVKGGLT